MLENNEPYIGSVVRVLAFVNVRDPRRSNSFIGVVPTVHCGRVSVMFDIILSSDFACHLYTGENSLPSKLGRPRDSAGFC